MSVLLVCYHVMLFIVTLECAPDRKLLAIRQHAVSQQWGIHIVHI